MKPARSAGAPPSTAAVAVEHDDLEPLRARAERARRRPPGRLAPPARRDRCRSASASSNASLGRVGAGDRLAPARRRRGRSASQRGRPRRASNAGRAGLAPSLVILATPPATVTRGTGWRAQIFQHAADEIAHVDQRRAPAGRTAPARRLPRSRRWRRRHASARRRARRRCRDGSSRSRRRRNRARRCRSCRGSTGRRRCRAAPFSVRSAMRSPSGIEISTTTSPPPSRQRFGDAARIIARGHGIDRGLAERQRQAGPRHRADALAGAERDARARRRARAVAIDQRAMRDVGIVARVLDDAGAREAVAALVHAPARRRRAGRRAGRSRRDRGSRRSRSAARPRARRRWRRRPSSSRGAAALRSLAAMRHRPERLAQ